MIKMEYLRSKLRLNVYLQFKNIILIRDILIKRPLKVPKRQIIIYIERQQYNFLLSSLDIIKLM